MKKAIITAFVVMLTAGTLQAQDDSGNARGDKHGAKHRGDPIAHLTEALNLSEDQAIEVATIMEESRAQHMAIQASVRDEHCAVREDTQTQIAAVLDDDQLAQFEDMHSQRKYRGRGHGMPRFADCDI